MSPLARVLIRNSTQTNLRFLLTGRAGLALRRFMLVW